MALNPTSLVVNGADVSADNPLPVSGSGGSGLTVGTTAITGGTTNRLLYDDAGKLGEAVVGSGLDLTAGTLTATGGAGTVTDMSVVSANGFAGTVADSTTTPAITLTTTITGVVRGNGTALSASKVAITEPATGSTLTIQDGFTLTADGNATVKGTNTGDQTTVSGNAGTATALATARAIYGNNFDGTAALTQVIASTYGGTGNGFTKFSGPGTSEKTFTLPDANSTILVSGGALGTPSSGNLANCTGIVVPGYASVGTHTVAGAEATISFTGLDNDDLLIVFDGIVGSAVGQSLLMKVSIDNGSTYTTTGVNTADTAVTTSALTYTMSATGAKIGYLSFVGGVPSATAAGINSTGSTVNGYQGNFNAGAKINAIQFLPSSGTFVVGSPGTVTVYAKN